MTQHSEHSQNDPAAASYRSLEVVTSAFLFALGALLITDSRRIGTGWADDGPQAGYFPFYIGLILCASCVVNLVSALRDPNTKTEAFLTRSQLKSVLTLVIPTTVFVITVKYLGIYLSAALLIGWFMRKLGRFAIPQTLLVACGIPGFLFGMFEVWFKVPLPKGPVEQLLGLG